MKNDFHLFLLSEKLDGAKAVTRLFFIRFIKKYGLTGRCELGIKEMVEVFGIHNNAISKAISFLVDGEFLERDQSQDLETSRKKGPSLKKLRIGESTRKLLSQSDISPSGILIHGSRIEDLLSTKSTWRKRHTGGVGPSGLSNAQILLLCVLYAHANEDGKVNGVSLADLTGLTGLNSNQLRASFRVLIAQEHMLPHKSGSICISGGWKTSEYSLSVPKATQDLTSIRRIRIKAFKSTQKAILLAHALNVLGSGQPFPQEARDLLGRTYQVEDEQFDSVLKCVKFLCAFPEISGKRFKLFCRAICICVESILINAKDSVINEDYIRRFLIESNWINKYIFDGEKGERKSSFEFIKDLVAEFIKEIRLLVDNSDNDSCLNFKITSLKLLSLTFVEINLVVDSDAGNAS